MVNGTETALKEIKLSQSKLDINDPGFQDVFADIQGNILKSHGRTHSRHLFLKFTGGEAANKAWLSVVSQRLTSALEQHKTALDFKQNGTEHLFTGLMLSYSGYKALGIDDNAIPDDKAFRAGMKDISFSYDTGPGGVHQRTVNPLNDQPKDWEAAFQENIDVLVVLAYGGNKADDVMCDTVLNQEVQKLQEEISGVAEVLAIQEGYALRNDEGTVIEHFGFADGVSNPVFLKSDYDRWENKEGTDQYDPSAGFGLIAVNDPGGKSQERSFGTYYVYRKLQQNIKGFNDQSKDFALQLTEASGKEVSQEYAGALTFGRFKDGTPLIKGSTGKTVRNNFDYSNDMEGMGCPFHSHMRKTNPRGDTNRKSNVPMWRERSHRIARRGISYGSKDLSPSTEWTNAGLLFLSCQSDIEQQFMVMQCGWSDNPNFLHENMGHDPISGDQNAGLDIAPKPWKLEIEGKQLTVDFRYKDLVKVRGGEYFFAPSISFFNKFKTN